MFLEKRALSTETRRAEPAYLGLLSGFASQWSLQYRYLLLEPHPGPECGIVAIITRAQAQLARETLRCDISALPSLSLCVWDRSLVVGNGTMTGWVIKNPPLLPSNTRSAAVCVGSGNIT